MDQLLKSPSNRLVPSVVQYSWTLIAVLLLPMQLQAATRCAFITEQRTAQIDLVEAKLLEGADTDWLERAEIDKVLTEQKLQSLFSPESTSDRLALGKLLQADLLIFVQSSTEEVDGESKPTTQVAVAQTASGLRLISRSFPVTADTEGDAQLLVDVIKQGIAKNQQEIQRVFAIPPFVSQDLTYEHDHLKQAFARLLEQALLDEPGTLVVELSEADAIAREAALAGADERLRRILPYYLLGEYRHRGAGQDLQLTVSLTMKRGATSLDSAEKSLSPDAAANFLLSSVRDFAKDLGGEASVVDPLTEAQQLAERAALFDRLNNLTEATALREASLLLNPRQVAVRRGAVIGANTLADQIPDKSETALMRKARWRARAAQHLQRLAADFSASELGDVRPLLNKFFIQTEPLLSNYVVTPEAIEKELLQCQANRNDACIKMAHLFAEAGDWSSSDFCLQCAINSLPATEQYQRRRQFIEQYQSDDPATIEMTKAYTVRAGYAPRPSVELAEHLRQLESSPNEHVRLAAVELADAAQQWRDSVNRVKEKAVAEGASTPEITFRSVDLLRYSRTRPPAPLREINGCLTLASGADVMWDRNRLYLVREKGAALVAWVVRHRWDQIRSVHYDGKYLWLTVYSPEEVPDVWLINTENWKWVTIGQEQGLPVLSRYELPDDEAQLAMNVTAIPLGPGEAIVMGDLKRVWLAHVKLDEEGTPQVRVFHEAKETVTPGSEDPWKNTHAVFEPRSLVLLTQSEDGSTVRKLYIGRPQTLGMYGHPLVVNLDDLSVTALESFWENPNQYQFSNMMMPYGATWKGRLYYTGPDLVNPVSAVRLLSFAADEVPRLELADVKEGYVLMDDDGTIHVVGRQWYQGQLQDSQLTSMGTVPWTYSNRFGVSRKNDDPPVEGDEIQLKRILQSKHYGYLVACEHQKLGPMLAEVVLDGSGQRLQDLFAKINDRPMLPPQVAAASPAVSGERAAESSDDILWDSQPRKIVDLAYVPGGRRVISLSNTPGAALATWDLKSGQLQSRLPAEAGGRGWMRLAVSPSGKYFAAGGGHGTVVLGTVQPLAVVRRLDDLDYDVTALDFSQDEERLTASDSDSHLIWKLAGEGNPTHLRGIFSSLQSLRFLPGGERILGVQPGGPAALWDANSGEFIEEVETLDFVYGISPTGAVVGYTGQGDNSLVGWNEKTRSFRTAWQGLPERPRVLSRDAKRLVTHTTGRESWGEAHWTHHIAVHDIGSRQTLLRLSGREYLKAAVFTPDNRTLLAVFGSAGRVQRIEIPAAAPPP